MAIDLFSMIKRAFSSLHFESVKGFRNLFVSTFVFTALLIASAHADGHGQEKEALDLLARLPIQSGGRVKPLDSFARDTMLFVLERRSVNEKYLIDAKSVLLPLYQRHGEHQAMIVLFDWILNHENWQKVDFIPIANLAAKKMMGLDQNKSHFSLSTIVALPTMQQIFESLQKKQARGGKLDATESAISRIISKVESIHAIVTGSALTILPPEVAGAASGASANADANGTAVHAWASLQAQPQSAISMAIGDVLRQLESTASSGTGTELLASVQNFATLQGLQIMRQNAEEFKALPAKMNREVQFNQWKPFQKSWMIYLLSFLVFCLALAWPRRSQSLWLSRGAWAIFISGFLVHSHGFFMRCMITGHPPVTNMYESTIWVPWGVVLFALILGFLYRNNAKRDLIATAGSAVALLSLVLADNVPGVLDPTIKPLEPVLRSNYWLTIHVLTITLSYAAFALSLGIGNWVLALYWRAKNAGEAQRNENIVTFSLFMYRAVQFGVVLLAAGTILGGVWADYSWGRFWGWDPKETWALIALLLYLAVLHGKWAGWLKPFGVVVGTVACFTGVIMAWYGVNFVLGVGLHSYGFSTGGLGAVTVFVIIQLAYLGFVVASRQARLKSR